MKETCFAEAGYAIIPDVFSAAECQALLLALEGSAAGRAGARHLMVNPAVRLVASDARLVEVARQALGSGAAVPFRATLFHKSSKANWLISWHQDTALPLARKFDGPEWGPWSRKAGVWYAHAPEWALKRVLALRVHLDASTHENGPLRVIPQTHHALLRDDEVEALVAERAESAVECVVGEGGVIAMRPLVIHASSKIVNDRPRRVLHIEYAAAEPDLKLREGIELRSA